MADPTHIWDIATGLLDAVVDLYAAEGIDLPERRVVVEGIPAFDCVSVIVSLRRVFRGLPNVSFGEQTLACAGIRTAEFHILILRCASAPDDDGNPPAVNVIQSFSEPIYTDAWVLTAGMQLAALNGSLGAACDDISIGELAVIGPEGAIGGVDLTVLWQLGGV